MPKQKSQKRRKSPKSSEVILKRPEGGANTRSAWILLLKRQFFEPEVAKYVIGKRENPPSWKAFWEKFVEGK